MMSETKIIGTTLMMNNQGWNPKPASLEIAVYHSSKYDEPAIHVYKDTSVGDLWTPAMLVSMLVTFFKQPKNRVILSDNGNIRERIITSETYNTRRGKANAWKVDGKFYRKDNYVSAEWLTNPDALAIALFELTAKTIPIHNWITASKYPI